MNIPSTPYPEPDGSRTVGHAGTAASRDAAKRETRLAGERQRRVLLMARTSGGVTVKDLREATGWHHGIASRILSNMDKGGHLVMLDERRDGCHVYVVPQAVNGRPLAARRCRAVEATLERLEVTDAMVEAAAEGIRKRLEWPSIYWGTKDLHPDALPHIARAALMAALEQED